MPSVERDPRLGVGLERDGARGQRPRSRLVLRADRSPFHWASTRRPIQAGGARKTWRRLGAWSCRGCGCWPSGAPSGSGTPGSRDPRPNPASRDDHQPNPSRRTCSGSGRAAALAPGDGAPARSVPCRARAFAPGLREDPTPASGRSHRRPPRPRRDGPRTDPVEVDHQHVPPAEVPLGQLLRNPCPCLNRLSRDFGLADAHLVRHCPPSSANPPAPGCSPRMPGVRSCTVSSARWILLLFDHPTSIAIGCGSSS